MEKIEGTSPTRVRQAQQRRDRIINASMKLFQEKCVEDTSMEEVAKRAGVGAATVYRYFSSKIELVIETAEVYWEKVSEKYLGELETGNMPNIADAKSEATSKMDGIESSGYDQLRKILNVFCRIFLEQKPFLKFLHEFDVFVKKYNVSEEHLADYENGILKLKPYVTIALGKGLVDKSLSFNCSVDEMYFSLTHTLLALMEKLAVGGDILSSDQNVESEKQIRIIIELLLRGIKNF